MLLLRQKNSAWKSDDGKIKTRWNEYWIDFKKNKRYKRYWLGSQRIKAADGEVWYKAFLARWIVSC